MHPILPLAISLHAMKGAYALLLGSGVSRAAEVPTGWEVELDLVRRVERLEGELCDPFPHEWYEAKYGERPDYSKLLARLAKTPPERSTLLRGYFEPTEEERERGIKQPTAAHRAIAELVKGGYVRVVVTTNFDRLLERALEEVGIVPTVIASADAAQGALPLAHTACTVVKIHGDYVDARIRNTEAELARYPRPLDRLLDRIFDEYGLIVCGWSTDWDPALRAALERCKSRRFATYWAVRNPRPPGAIAQRLIDLRGAEVVPIPDADAFFVRLGELVASLEEVDRPHPLSAKLVRATMKRYLAEERHRIRLHDLMTEEVERVHVELTEPLKGGNPQIYRGEPGGESLAQRLAVYEALTETVMALFATGCYWGNEGQHALWASGLERLANLPELGGHPTWVDLRRYPALLALYAGGIAAIAAGRYDTLAAQLTRGRVRRQGRDEPLVLAVNTHRVLDVERARLLPGKERHHLPFNDRLYESGALREALRELLPMEERFEECFDRFEYLLGLVHMDLGFRQELAGGWAPAGCFAWRYRHRAPTLADAIGAEIDADASSWLPLRAGLFGSSLERAREAKAAYDDLMRDWTRAW